MPETRRSGPVALATALFAALALAAIAPSRAHASLAETTPAANAETAPASIAEAPRILWRAGKLVRAGEMVEIHWSAPGSTVDELEIQLSLDGGRHYNLRISPELDPRVGEFVWRVPNLASGDARVRLRYSRDGREIEGEPSPPFRISAGENADPELAQIYEGIWWTGLRGLDLRGALEAFEPAGATLKVSIGRELSGLLPRSPTGTFRIAARLPVLLSHVESREGLVPRPGAPPRVIPARN